MVALLSKIFHDEKKSIISLDESFTTCRWHKDMHIIHRDLKPDNIGFSADGVLKLFDFGLCACVKAQNTRHDTYKMTGNTGTLRYMAPEVALGAPYNKTVDVYSFSVIMWQVFTGKIPFSSLGRKAFMDKVIVGRARPYLDSSWPQRFRSLLEKCWNHDKDKRPDIADVLNEIDTLILEAENDAKLNASSIDVLGESALCAFDMHSESSISH
jgi:serine/threonine protein kinase